MEKVYGSPKRQDGLYKIGRDKWELIYGYDVDNESDTSGWNWRHRYQNHKPSWDEVKAQLVDAINEQTRETIVTGFKWNGQKIWLTEQVQLNFASIERAKCPDEYPINIKVNEDADGEAIYMEFASAEEFAEFHRKASEHIFAALEIGWNEKKALKKSDFGFTD